MAKRRQSGEEVREILVERLRWQTARRNDGQVAQAVHAGEELEAVFPLGEVGLLDEFYHFLEVTGVLAQLTALELPNLERMFLPVIQFMLLYLVKTLVGIESMNALPALLFSNVAAMTLLGFNAHQVANGLTVRGDA